VLQGWLSWGVMKSIFKVYPSSPTDWAIRADFTIALWTTNLDHRTELSNGQHGYFGMELHTGVES
jgi:hypothetical protein